jgi:hypothetical protein
MKNFRVIHPKDLQDGDLIQAINRLQHKAIEEGMANAERIDHETLVFGVSARENDRNFFDLEYESREGLRLTCTINRRQWVAILRECDEEES